jgi:hypothetical protein
MSNETLKVKRVFKSYGKIYQSGFQFVLHGIVIRLKRIYNF